MAGFSSVKDDEDIVYADNISFDGTQRGGKITTDGQLLIGSSTEPHIRVGTISSGNGIQVTNTAGDITIASTIDSVSISDGPNLDAFSRLRVSNPTSLFANKNHYDTNPSKMEGGSSGTGVSPTHNASTLMVELSTTAGTGVSYLQSYQYIPYQPSKSQFIAVTGVLGAGVAGSVVDVGYGDSKNGIFYRQNGASGLQLVLRTSTSGSPTETVINQSAWNLNPLLTGSTVLDETKCFILIIDLQFLGMGRVRVGFDIDGVIVYVHEFLNANVLTGTYMQTATLPISYVITSTSTSSTKTCYYKCSAVNSEGGFQNFQGYQLSTGDASVTAASGARTHLLSVRPRTTFNSLENRSYFTLKQLNVLVTGNSPVFWELCVGVTFSVDPTWSNINATYSSYEQGTGGTYSGLSGFVIDSGYVPATNQVKNAASADTFQYIPISLDRAGAQRSLGTLSLLVTGLGGTSATRGSIVYEEIR